MISSGIKFYAMLIALLCLLSQNAFTQNNKKRVIVLTDIEADPDDTQSLIRFLLYSNQWDVEGLIATTSIHQRNNVFPESIHKILKGYQKVQPNLLLHEKGFPTYETLAKVVKKGLPSYGMEGVGPGKDSEGSNWIVQQLLKKDDRPIWFSVWGGPNTLAQALLKIKETQPETEAAKAFNKVRIYTISDQDNSGPWIRKTFPNIFFVVTPGYNYTYATWLGMSAKAPGSVHESVSNEWLAQNIQQGHGPLGALYPDVAYGMEGDSPAYLSLIENGLNDAQNPNFGGWGGRYEYYLPPFKDSNAGGFKRENWPKDEAETRAIWTNASDSLRGIDKLPYKSNTATIWRWRTAVQNDFAARIDWTTKKFNEVNHPPIIKTTHPDNFTVKSGEEFFLNADGTTDPDGDSMSYLWFQYKEAGTFPGYISTRPFSPNLYRLPITAPKVDKPETIHLILQVTDKGKPALTRYKRIVVKIMPN